MSPDLRQVRYLLADSDPLDVRVVTFMLKSDPLKHVIVHNTPTFSGAMNFLAGSAYDVLILNLNLPDNHGLDPIGVLLEEYPSLPIIIITGTDDHESAVACLKLGVQDYIAKDQVNAEVINRSIRYAIERKRIDIELKQALEDADEKNRQLTLLARTDTLTKLPNRAYFYDVAEQAIAMAERNNMAIGILYFDLNGFKNINDTFGHPAGDKVLIEVARRLKTRLRNSDIVARVGGDEFIVLTNALQDAVQAYSVAKKVNEIICEPMQIDNAELYVSASIGIATYPEVGSIDKLVQCADLAMYEAKANKHHFASFFTKNLEKKHRDQQILEDALASAITDRQLHASYQPIVSRENADRFSVEALCRWRSQNLGPVSPEIFIPIAASSNLGDKLASFMLEEGSQLNQLFRENKLPLHRLSINFFGRQIADGRFADRLLNELATLNFPPSLLCIESTEKQLLENLDACKIQLKKLKDSGVKIALDDFGTGFSSLTHLKNLPIDVLKLDVSLINQIDEKNKNQALCDGIVHMAHKLNIKVVAEGIERREEFKTLADMGCDEYQGHLFGSPMSDVSVLQHSRHAQWFQ